MPNNTSGRTGQRNIKATRAGLIRELGFWPGLVCGALGFSVLEGPNQYLILAAFLLSVAIIITTHGKQRLAACWVMVIFMLVNAWQIHYEPEVLASDPRFWIANRVLYAVGLAFYLQPILGRLFDSEKGRTVAIVIGSLLIFAGFFLYVESRSNVTLPGAWYTPEMLYDDVCIGIASGLLFGALSGSGRTNKAGTRQS